MGRGRESRRGYIERKAIALLSNYGQAALDPPSKARLGRGCERERVRSSGLWKRRHVDEQHGTSFLDKLEALTLAGGVE